jgi:CO/xanthine dehydrogenase Mo-binding subunit
MVVIPNMLGQRIKRGEDPRLVSGTGAYLEDLALPGLVHLVSVRSPHGHARSGHIDVAAARQAPGVLLVLTGSDLDARIPRDLPGDWPPYEGEHRPPNQLLARDKVRYVGEAVAIVIAETREQAHDAIDLIDIDYEPLPAVSDPDAALSPGAPLLYEEFGTNLAHRLEKRGGDVEAAFARPDVQIVKGRFNNPRVLPVPMETRGAAARYDPGTGGLTFWASTQFPHAMRTRMAEILGLAENDVRVIAPDVGENFILPAQFPYTTPLGTSYDTGDYPPAFDRLLAMADYVELRRQQALVRARGEVMGIGMSAYLEICAFGPWESATVRVESSGKVTVLAGTSPHGQGHMTPFRQIVADQLGVPLEDIRVVFNDTSIVATGVGTFGSRSAAIGGSAVLGASERVRGKVIRIAAEALEASIDDIEISPGRIGVRGVPDRSTTLAVIAGRAYSGKVPDGDEPGLDANRFFKPEGETFPFGMHLAVVEIDRDTGKVQLVRYLAVDDCGRVLNPMMVDGQLHGGIAQGVGQALFEEVQYDTSGQLLTSTLGDYALPRAADFPQFELDMTETLTPRNPLGAKGIGEAGTIGSTSAVVNAVIDALRPYGVKDFDMPASPEKIWKVLNR